MGRPAMPGPANSRTLFFTKPFLYTAPQRAMATSWGPTPWAGEPVR